MITTSISNIRERILFFSPFIKNMPIGQFEFGVIPHWREMKLTNQGEHGGIVEYLLD